jgi:four helix bundle protein
MGAGMDKNDLQKRTKKFAIDIISYTDSLPKNSIFYIIGNQLLRAGTSIGANYRASLRAKSKADFIYKVKIVEEEADETCHWLELILESDIKTPEKTEILWKEANELTAIFTKIGITSRQNQKKE